MLVSNRYPFLEIVFNVRDYKQKSWAYLDTGFDGYLIIPSTLFGTLGEGDYVGRWQLGDSSTAESVEYLGTIEVLGTDLSTIARITCLGNEFLLGREIIDQFKITFEYGKRLVVDS